eukprot:m.223881 g.223881  ORF g.223881 m.223881 type:complete len:1082 (-) comp17276_c0_seq1:1276-4521(-)
MALRGRSDSISVAELIQQRARPRTDSLRRGSEPLSAAQAARMAASPQAHAEMMRSTRSRSGSLRGSRRDSRRSVLSGHSGDGSSGFSAAPAEPPQAPLSAPPDDLPSMGSASLHSDSSWERESGSFFAQSEQSSMFEDPVSPKGSQHGQRVSSYPGANPIASIAEQRREEPSYGHRSSQPSTGLQRQSPVSTRAYMQRTDPSPVRPSQPLGSVPSLQTPRTRARLSSLEAKRRQSDPLPAVEPALPTQPTRDAPRRGSLSVKQLQADFLTRRDRSNTLANPPSTRPTGHIRPSSSEGAARHDLSASTAMIPANPSNQRTSKPSQPTRGSDVISSEVEQSRPERNLEPTYPRASIAPARFQPEYSAASPPLSPVEPYAAPPGPDPTSPRQLYTSSPLRHIRRSPAPTETQARQDPLVSAQSPVSTQSSRFDYSPDTIARHHDTSLGVAPLSPVQAPPQPTVQPLRRQGSKAFGSLPVRDGEEPRMQVSAASHLNLNRDGAQLQSTARFQGPVLAVASSAGGSMVAAGGKDGVVRLYDAFQGVVTQELRYHRGSVNAVAFSPRGSRLASAGEDTRIVVWEVLTGTLQHELTQHTESVRSLVFSESGEMMLSASVDESVIVWSTTDFTMIDYFKYDTMHACFCVALSPREDMMAEGSFDGTVRLWSLGPDTRVHTKLVELRQKADKQALAQFRSRPGQVQLREGKRRARQAKLAYFGAGNDDSVHDDDANRSNSPMGLSRPIRLLEGHPSAVISVQFTPDGTLLASASHDGTVSLWDPTTGERVRALTSNTGSPVWACSFSKDGTIIVLGSGDGHVDFFDPLTGHILLSFQAHEDYVTATTFSSDGLMLLTGSHDKTLRVWKLLPSTNLLKLLKDRLRQLAREEELEQRRQRELHQLQANRVEPTPAPREPDDIDLHKSRGMAGLAEDDGFLSSRARALKELVDLRRRRLEREGHARAAAGIAQANAKRNIAKDTKDAFARLAAKQRHRELGIAVPGVDFRPDNDALFVSNLHSRLKTLYNRIGREPMGDTWTFTKLEEVAPGDLERQLFFEGTLLRTLRYHPFDPKTLEQLGMPLENESAVQQ